VAREMVRSCSPANSKVAEAKVLGVSRTGRVAICNLGETHVEW
jgi:hypothetical protein